MIYWTPLELEQVFNGWDSLSSQVKEIDYQGVMLQVQPLEEGKGQIVRLLSTEPLDYLNPAYAPGTIIPMN